MNEWVWVAITKILLFFDFVETESEPTFNEVVYDVEEDFVLKATRIVGYAIDWVRGLLETPGKAFLLFGILSAFLWQILIMMNIAFGIIYKWLSLSLQSPESQLGAGLGGTVLMALGIHYYWPWSAIIVGICIGALLGGCFFSGFYKLLFVCR